MPKVSPGQIDRTATHAVGTGSTGGVPEGVPGPPGRRLTAVFRVACSRSVAPIVVITGLSGIPGRTNLGQKIAAELAYLGHTVL